MSPESAAKSILRDLNIITLDDLQYLEEIAYTRGALVQYAPLTGAEARISIVGDRAVITIAESISNRHRRRFSIAHELGHFELHRRQLPRSSCTTDDLNSWSSKGTSRDPEREANTFAAVLLLPETFFTALCDEADPSLDYVSELAARFDVSLTATALRYIHFAEATCAVVYCRDGRIEWAQGSTSFKERGFFIDGGTVDPRSIAASLFRGNRITRPREVAADVWLTTGRYQEDARINEQSWLQQDYGSTLTLLWADDEIELADDDILLWL